jgi:hypothetical protein
VLRDEFEKSMSKNNRSGRRIFYGSKNFFLQDHTFNSQTERRYRPKGEYEKKLLSIFTSL